MVYNQPGGTVSAQSVSGMTGLNLAIMGNSAAATAAAASPLLYTPGAFGVPSAVPAIYSGAYFKLGFRYNAKDATVTPYINGIPQDGRIAPNKVIGSGSLSTNLGTAAPGTGSTTLWPAVPMTFAAGLWQTGTTTYQTMTIDWWKCAQLTQPR